MLHVDLSQALGKVPVDVRAMGADFATVAGHKLYCPKGVGALYIREGAGDFLDVWMHGGGQEKGLRGGTENVILYAGLGKACEVLRHRLEAGLTSVLREKRDRLEDVIMKGLKQHGLESQVRRNGLTRNMLP